jgi:hypothetical protein
MMTVEVLGLILQVEFEDDSILQFDRNGLYQKDRLMVVMILSCWELLI